MGGRGSKSAVSPVEAVKASGGNGIADFNKSAYARRNEIAPNKGSNNTKLTREVKRNLHANAVRAR